MASETERVSTAEIKCMAKDSAKAFLTFADAAGSAREAADWSLAAKNAVSIVLTTEQIVKTRNAH